MNEEKLSAIAQKLWDLDNNRFINGKNFEINLQKSAVKLDDAYVDRCDKPLFKYLDENSINEIPTYKTFIALLDNYITHVGGREIVTEVELKEQNDFIDALLGTCVMREAYRFLMNEKIIKNNLREFKNLLNTIWFQMYYRNANTRINDSCAFEHVFIGETNEQGAIGCHNWLQYYLLEKKQLANYYGYMPGLCLYSIDKSFPDMITMRFCREGSIKSLGGFFLGVSPEFEIALYTILYLCGDEKTKLNFANMNVTFNCYKMQRYGKTVLATIYPSKN